MDELKNCDCNNNVKHVKCIKPASKTCDKRRHRRGKKGNKQINKNCTVKIAFNNVNRLRPKLYELSKLLNDQEIHVFGVAESFLKDDEIVNIHGYRWIGKNRCNKGGGGIGCFVSNNVTVLDDNVFESISDEYERMWIKLCFDEGRPMYVAITYFPVEGTDVDVTDELYNQLLSEVIQLEHFHTDSDPDIVIMGDMNARIGREIPNGDPVLNSNGERLLNFRNDSNLSILNCSRMCIGKFTWFRGNLKSTIDYMLCSNNIVHHVKEFIVDEDRDFGLASDHNVLLLKLKLSFKNRKNNIDKCNKIIWDIKKDQDFTRYQNQLKCKFQNWDAKSFDDPNCLYNSWKDNVLEAAKEGLGVKQIKGKHNAWFDKDVDNAIKDRRRACQSHRQWANGNNGDNTAGDELWQTYQNKRIHAKNLIRQKITDMRVNRSIDIAKKGGTSSRDFWKFLRGSNVSRNNTDTHCIKAPNTSEIIFDRKVMNQTIMQYWSTLGKMNLSLHKDDANLELTKSKINNIRRNNVLDFNNFKTSDNGNCVGLYDIDIDIDTVVEALSHAKNNKAPGADFITNELLKNGGDSLNNSILCMFKRLLFLERVPKEWNHSIIVPIFKKGDRKELDNYRGISLSSCVSKVFNRIVAQNVSKFLEDNNVLSEIQGGFRPSFSTTDHVFILKSIAACRLAEGKKTYMAFLDFRKAFDTVWRDGLMLAIWNTGIRGKIWKIIDSLYDNVKAQVRFGNLITNDFNVEEGVKQGCALSPVLFCIFINEFAKLLRDHNVGVRIHDVCMGGLFWADDVVLLANDEQELNKMLDLAAQFSRDWRLNFNHSKSNVLVVGQRINGDKKWKLGNDYISEVNTYKYLGVHISRTLSDHHHVDEVIKKGNRLIAYVKSIISNFDNFNRVYYGDILWRTIALPSINYASSVWMTNSKRDLNRLEGLQMQMARYILKAPRNTPQAALYGDLGWLSISNSQDTFKAKYLSRVINMDMHRWPKLLLNTMLNNFGQNLDSMRYKFLSHVDNVVKELGIHDIFECALTETNSMNPHWARSIKMLNYDRFSRKWMEGAKSKSSLSDYITLKSSPGLEQYLLDKTDFTGVSLKFKLRSNTLQLDNRICKWTNDNNGICKLCNDGIEDVKHFLFTCIKLNDIRIEEYNHLRNNLILNNCHDVWDLFITGNLDIKLHLTLGSTTSTYANIYDAQTVYNVFDLFCKSYAKRAWYERCKLKLQ